MMFGYLGVVCVVIGLVLYFCVVGVNWWEVDCDLMVYVEVLVLCAVVW